MGINKRRHKTKLVLIQEDGTDKWSKPKEHARWIPYCEHTNSKSSIAEGEDEKEYYTGLCRKCQNQVHKFLNRFEVHFLANYENSCCGGDTPDYPKQMTEDWRNKITDKDLEEVGSVLFSYYNKFVDYYTLTDADKYKLIMDIKEILLVTSVALTKCSGGKLANEE